MSYRTELPSWSCSQAVSRPVWHIPLLCVQWKTPDDGQRNCLVHVEFYSKNKFEELVHLVSFIIRICHDAWSPERQTLWILCQFCPENTERLGVQTLVGARFSTPIQTGPEVHLFSCTVGTGSLSLGYSGSGMMLTTQPLSIAKVVNE